MKTTLNDPDENFEKKFENDKNENQDEKILEDEEVQTNFTLKFNSSITSKKCAFKLTLKTTSTAISKSNKSNAIFKAIVLKSKTEKSIAKSNDDQNSKSFEILKEEKRALNMYRQTQIPSRLSNNQKIKVMSRNMV